MERRQYCLLIAAATLFSVLSFFEPSAADTIQLTEGNIQSIFARHELVFVNFYADWCRFSQILAPVFDESSKKIKEEFPNPGKIAFGRVDCDAETSVSSSYHISKYPTLKLFRNGQAVKKEYRGQRSVDALAEYIREQLRDPIQEVKTSEGLDELEAKKRNIIGYFADKESEGYKTYMRVASQLRDDCPFYAAFGPVAEAERNGADTIAFRPPNTHRQDKIFTGAITNYDHLQQWIFDKCVPLVREITFENAEELTEEGLPFLILFHHPDDHDIVEKFTAEVSKQLLSEKNNVNFLTADGLKFTHPLHHLGKSTNDLPVLAIDSFRHMYVFPHSVKENIAKSALLKQFIDDLHSGKLHREFHHGPDPTEPPQITDDTKVMTNNDQDAKQPTSPPESTFKKLKPSRNRYTLVRDEL
ncbi:endoplasmic reticulum resident protein 44 [Octopus sinensis]|uniref:Endoplasmic reticulum resident protein 44 n=1 Tax=Octopus sinensis TaxID=2607531 RepID=A0A6P7TM05_9MOLL|nr:endoplasmic reticulum resident protein 44 [Octopus sinensis]